MYRSWQSVSQNCGSMIKMNSYMILHLSGYVYLYEYYCICLNVCVCINRLALHRSNMCTDLKHCESREGTSVKVKQIMRTDTLVL